MSSPEAQCWFLGLSVIKNYSCTCRGSQAWCCRFTPVLLVTPMSSMCCSILIGILKIRQQFPLTKSFRKTDKKYLFLCLRRLFYFLPVSPNPQSYFISEREVDIYIFFRRLCNTRERSWTQPRLMIFFPKDQCPAISQMNQLCKAKVCITVSLLRAPKLQDSHYQGRCHSSMGHLPQRTRGMSRDTWKIVFHLILRFSGTCGSYSEIKQRDNQ